MRYLLIVVLALQLASPTTAVAGGSQKRQEMLVARVLQRVAVAWRAGDRTSWVDEFSEDAYFTVRFEMSDRGKEEIAWSHLLIFDNFHADTAFDIDVRQVRFVRPGVVVAQLGGFSSNADTSSSALVYGTPTVVLELENDKWKVVAFQNTPFVVDEYRAYGNLRRFKVISAANTR